MYDDGMQCSGVQWNGSMECNAVEWNAMDAFWSFWVILTLLVILGPNLIVFAKKNKKVNFATRRRQIHPTNFLKNMFTSEKNNFPEMFFFVPKRKKVNFATRRRQIHPTN